MAHRVVASWLIAIAAALGQSVPLRAQCPDGSAPPCRSAARRLPALNSVAVLYFDNLTRDSAYAYLADGLTEDLIAMLGRVVRLDVKSRYESARVRGVRGLGPQDVGRRLNVAYFVSGSVQPGSGRIRVDAELIDARSGHRVWGDRLTATGTDPLAVQESIATAVVQQVVGIVLPEERVVLARRATRDSAAYDLYLQGQFFFKGYNEYYLRHAIDLYQQALARDSTFALAWAGIAQAWVYLADAWVAPLKAYPRAREAAGRALALDTTVALAYAALVWPAVQVDFDFVRGERLARRAVALDPRLGEAHVGLAFVLGVRRKEAEALKEWRRAWELDSLSVEVAESYWGGLMRLGRSAEVLAATHHAPPVLTAVAASYGVWAMLHLRECEEAEAERRRLSGGRSGVGTLAGITAICVGDRDGGRAAIISEQTAAAWDSTHGSLPGWMSMATGNAEIYAALGDLDSAFAWLERAYQRREYALLLINRREWWLDALQGDRRFAALVKRIGLPWPAPVRPR